MSKAVEDIVKAARAAVTEIDVAKARELHRAGVTFIDVREPGECAKGSIPGALEYPRGVLEWKVSTDNSLADQAQPIVVYCQSGGRSALSAIALKNLGYTEVSSLAGGYGAWSAED